VTIYGQTRILYAISRDGLISKSFQKVDPRTSAPVVNTVIVSAVVALVAGFVDATFLWDMVSMGTLTAFIVVAVAVPVMRKKERAAGTYKKGGFRVPFGPYVVPGLSILACLYIMKDLSHTTRVIFSIWMGASVLTYFAYGIRNSRLNQA
jgi:APA family basic amino acid/polyamine antiporter